MRAVLTWLLATNAGRISFVGNPFAGHIANHVVVRRCGCRVSRNVVCHRAFTFFYIAEVTSKYTLNFQHC